MAKSDKKHKNAQTIAEVINSSRFCFHSFYSVHVFSLLAREDIENINLRRRRRTRAALPLPLLPRVAENKFPPESRASE